MDSTIYGVCIVLILVVMYMSYSIEQTVRFKWGTSNAIYDINFPKDSYTSLEMTKIKEKTGTTWKPVNQVTKFGPMILGKASRKTASGSETISYDYNFDMVFLDTLDATGKQVKRITLVKYT